MRVLREPCIDTAHVEAMLAGEGAHLVRGRGRGSTLRMQLGLGSGARGSGFGVGCEAAAAYEGAEVLLALLHDRVREDVPGGGEGWG